MKKAVIIIIMIVLAGGVAWFVLRDRGATNEQEGPKDYPVSFRESESSAGLARYESEFTDLAFAYPDNWNVTEGADNSEASQLLTVESPLDAHEFYFCLDVYVVSDAEAEDFSVPDAQIVAVDALDSGHHSVLYTVDAVAGLLWGVTDEAPQVGAQGFLSEITSDTGYRLQVFGRFSCREETKPEITAGQFQDSRWFHETTNIVNSIEF